MKKNEEEVKVDSLANVDIVSSVANTVQRYGSAVKEHLVALSGLDHESGTRLARSLKDIAAYKINPNFAEANIRQHAGFAAEVKAVARRNAEAVISGESTRMVRTDDIGRVNDPLYDHVMVDAHGNVIAGSGTQMKFIGKTPEDSFKHLMSAKGQTYRDGNISLSIPSERLEGIRKAADKEIAKLQRQVDAVTAKEGNPELVETLQAQIRKAQKVKRLVKDSGVTTKEAREAVTRPRLSTVKDVARDAGKAGAHGALIGGTVAGGLSLCRNIAAVSRGEKGVGDALKDTGEDVLKGAGGGFVVTAGGSALKGVMQNSSSSLLRSASRTAVPAYAAFAVVDMGTTLVKFGSGKISGSHCTCELVEKGAATACSYAGWQAGAAIGTALIPIPFVGTVLGAAGGIAASYCCNKYFQSGRLLEERTRAACKQVALSCGQTQTLNADMFYLQANVWMSAICAECIIEDTLKGANTAAHNFADLQYIAEHSFDKIQHNLQTLEGLDQEMECLNQEIDQILATALGGLSVAKR